MKKYDNTSGTMNMLSIPPEDIDGMLSKTSPNQTLDLWVRLQEEKSQKIEKLQRELNEKTKAISELLAVKKNTKNVYYIGFLTGIIGIIAGLFSNFVYTLAGLSITITASVGIYEARKNKW